MMTVNNAVVGKSEVAVFLHIGNAVIAVLFFKAAFQIVVRIDVYKRQLIYIEYTL